MGDLLQTLWHCSIVLMAQREREQKTNTRDVSSASCLLLERVGQAAAGLNKLKCDGRKQLRLAAVMERAGLLHIMGNRLR